MSKKKTAIDRAIEQLEADIATTQLAIKKLREQQAKVPVRKPRAVEKVGA